MGNIKDVELAILEPNGQISTTLKPEKVPATKERYIKNIGPIREKNIAFFKNESFPETPPLFKEFMMK
ncbi:YetF domain-containing protein [Peribacillus simplex]|uniref:YetF domain-containing protein n=1 Tax=Peribacillus simplex TaxID=1478 RepID=UPI003B8E1C53